MIKYEFYGTSHGEGYGGTIYNLPTGISVDVEQINEQLRLRKTGDGRSSRQRELDKVVLTGLVDGKTTDKLEFFVANGSHSKKEQITALRSGHLDLVASVRHNTIDIRSLNEVGSARNSLCYVVVGAICKQILATQSIFTSSVVTNVFGDIAEAKKTGDSIGGVVTVVASGVKLGQLGDFFPYEKRLDGKIAGAMLSIPSVKGIEFGSTVYSSGKQNADKLAVIDGNIVYATNNAGGIVAGITNGCDVVFSLTVKPIPTVRDVLSIDIETKQTVTAHYERADTCVVQNVGVIAENMLATLLVKEIYD